ncbi:MAG: TonB-dependent receptor [Gammaproteobacteria bacterium]|nr:TonB-dependent receptor [Gammaproteobacteria bacterium]
MIQQQILIAIAVVAALPATATADADAVDEITVVATRRPVGIDEVSAPVATVDRDTVIAQKLTTDALRDLAGVSLQQTTPGQGAAIVRGLKGSAVLHLVDGMRLSNAMFRSAPTPWFALVPATSVERLEVVRGTPASLHGSEAVGGVVQSVSRLPDFDSSEVDSAGDVSASFDTAELQKSVRATLDVGSRQLSSSVSAEYLSTGDRRVGGGERIGPSGYISKGLRAVVRGRPADERSWFVDLHFLEQPETPRVDELVAGYEQTAPASSEFLFAPNQRWFAHVQHRQLADSGINWTVDAAWQRIVDDRTNRNFAATDRRLEENRSDLYGLTLNASSDKGRVAWIGGIDLYHDEVRSTRRSVDITDGSMNVLAPRFPDGSTVLQAGLFGNLNWRLADRHGLSAGLRFSDVTIELPDGTTIDPARLSGDVGWIFDLAETWQVVANAGSGFRAPNIADLGTLGERPGNRFNIPNANLSAETVTHGDVGLRHYSERWRFELMVFALRYADRIVSVATGDVSPDGRDIVQSVNAASSSIRGIESGLDARLSDRLSLKIVVNYTRGEQQVVTAVEPADRVPPLNGHLLFTYQSGDRWQFEAWLRAAARQDRLSARDADDPRIDPDGTAGWASLGASASWSSDNGWQVIVSADNLADKQYRIHGSGIDAPGRNLSATIRRRW